jgi:PAS domain S-box-containing protein
MSSHSPTAGSPIDDRERLFAGRGEMRGRFRTFDWNESPLGPVGSWSRSLRSTATTVLASAFPNVLLWGPELIQLYNDGYREVMGAKHPSGLGIPTRECWPEAWEFNEPIYQRVFTGETVSFEDVRIPIVRYGTLEDVYFTISYSPVLGDDTSVGGVLVTLLETTARVVARKLEGEREALLRQVEVERNRLGTVFQQAPAFLAVLRGMDHVFELANDSYARLVGHRDVIGRSVDDALPEVRAQGFVDLLDHVLSTGEPFHGHEVPVMLVCAPGGEPEQRFVDFVYQALVEADGTRSGVVAHGFDVTEQVMARREVERLLAESERQRADLDGANLRLQASEARLRDVFDQAPMAVAVLSGPDHVYTVASPMYSRYLGGRPLVGRAFREAVPEPGGQRVALLMDQVYQTGEPIVKREQVVPLDRDGAGELTDYLFDISYQPLRDAEGKVYAITSLSLDVTEQVRARELSEAASRAIASARRQLEHVFSQAPVAIAVIEGDARRFTLANGEYERLIGRANLVGRTIEEVLPELGGQAVLQQLDHVFRTGEPLVGNEVPVAIRRATGSDPEEAFFNFVLQPLHDGEGTRHAVVVVAVEVTVQVRARRTVEGLLAESEESRSALQQANTQLEEQQVELEIANQQLQDNAVELEAQAAELEAQAAELEMQTAELEEQTRAADHANRAKGEFLATMSHELRTPLNAISGYADLLLAGVRGDLTGPQRGDVERVRRSGQHLLGLINSILNFAKLDAGQVEFRTTTTPLFAVLDGVEDLVGPQLAAKSITFRTSGCADDATVRVDEEKTRQVLLNLLSNAIKFTEAGGTVELTCETDDTWARVEVRDTGRGIPPDQLERVFDPFVQVDRHLTPASQQGVGLGLAISRDLAVGMGGVLTAASEVGAGSRFTLLLPRG